MKTEDMQETGIVQHRDHFAYDSQFGFGNFKPDIESLHHSSPEVLSWS